MESTAAPTPRDALFRMLFGFPVTQLIYVAAKLGIADLLNDGPKSSQELAARTGANADRLHRVMRALSSVGVFEDTGARGFALTPVASLLRSDRPGSARPMAIFLGEQSYPCWTELLHGVMTGETPAERVYGMAHFEYLQQHPEASAVFDATMSAISRRALEGVVTTYDFSGARIVVDVGGGQGVLIAGILRANPALRGILFDRPNVIAGADGALAAAGVAERCELVGGDFFAELPSGGDIYVLRNVIHDWDDGPAIDILRNCARAMAADGRVLVMESIIEAGDSPPAAKFLDLQMLVMNGGRERSADEFRALYTAAGLELRRIIPVTIDSRIVEGARAGA